MLTLLTLLTLPYLLTLLTYLTGALSYVWNQAGALKKQEAIG